MPVKGVGAAKCGGVGAVVPATIVLGVAPCCGCSIVICGGPAPVDEDA